MQSNFLKRSKRALAAVAATSTLLLGAVVPTVVGTATAASAASLDGCSYGTGGPKADALCWIDMSDFGTVTASDLASGPVSKNLSIEVKGYKVTATATVTAGADGANGVSATALPTWGGSVLGKKQSGQDFYVGTTGKPALYQPVAVPDVSKDFAERDKITLSDIKVYNKAGDQVNSGYSMVMADAESTGPTHEGFTWTSDKVLNKYTEATPSGSNWLAPCSESVTGLGTQTVVCAAADTSGKSNGIMMVSADSPTEVSASFNNAQYASSRQGVAFALVFSTAVPGVDVTQADGSDAEFTTTASTGGSATSDDGSVTSNEPFLGNSDETSTTYTVTKTDGDTSEDAYDLSWKCTVNGTEVTPVLSDDGKSATVDTPANGASSCVAYLVAKGPSTGPGTATSNPTTDAIELSDLATTAGNGAIKTATFDNGTDTKVTDDGTWKLTVDSDGKVSATFTPNSTNVTGKIPTVTYTVTDEYGLTASSTLDVTINTPPTTGDYSVTVGQGEVATLTPKSVPGNSDIKSAVFDNGETTKVVAGEGTWTIEVKDGQPVATFTPEDGFTGPVTKQSYTVTDENGLTSNAGGLEVIVKPKTDSDKVTINPNTTATLKPVTTKGSGDITSVAFDNGETTKTVDGEGTWTIKLVDGQPVATFTPEEGYTGSVTQQKYTVTDSNDLTATSTLDVDINVPPTTGNKHETINPNETATLTPKSVPGNSDIKSAVFDNGETTKVVAGEGTWTIEVKDGQPVATFTPEKDYTGTVTSQTYTVTDENGLTSNLGELSIDINTPPTTGDDSAVINPNDVAKLTDLKTVPGSGDITSAVFDNGETTKVVPGEGTWEIILGDDGVPTATFTPEKDYHGTVTSQDYTVTDENGLTATGTLSVKINTPPTTGDESVTVAQGETATLDDLKTTPGNSDITGVKFNEGDKGTLSEDGKTLTVPGEGVWTIELVDGKAVAKFVPEAGFTGPVTQQTYTVTDENKLTATGKLDVIIKPATGDDSAVINPNDVAKLTDLKTVPGSGDITSAVFDNGETTKVVPGEGTWEIILGDDGVPTATFTPEKDYHGTVTSQDYTVTDENGLTATGTLSVKINTPPQANDKFVTIPQGGSYTFDPIADLVKAGTSKDLTISLPKHDDGDANTLTVPGEGVWTLDPATGKITFTAESGFIGKGTPIDYTVTDGNGLVASAQLGVTVTPTPSGSATPTPTPSASSSASTDDDGSTDDDQLATTGLAVGGVSAALGLIALGALALAYRKRKHN